MKIKSQKKSRAINEAECKAQEASWMNALMNNNNIVLGYKKQVRDVIKNAGLLVDFAVYDKVVDKNVELTFTNEQIPEFLSTIDAIEKIVANMTSKEVQRVRQAFFQARFEVYNNMSPDVKTLDKNMFAGDIAHCFFYLGMSRLYLGLGSVNSKFYKDIQNKVESFFSTL